MWGRGSVPKCGTLTRMGVRVPGAGWRTIGKDPSTSDSSPQTETSLERVSRRVLGFLLLCPLRVVALRMILMVAYGESALPGLNRYLTAGADHCAGSRHPRVFRATTVRQHCRHRFARFFGQRSVRSAETGSPPRARSLARRRWPYRFPPRSSSWRPPQLHDSRGLIRTASACAKNAPRRNDTNPLKKSAILCITFGGPLQKLRPCSKDWY